MSSTSGRARFEVELAKAHRALYNAQGRAEELGDQAGHDELYDLLLRVGALMERSLTKRPNRQIQGQTRLV